jgi:hypothetical protein
MGYWKLLRSVATAKLAINNPDEAFTCLQAPLAARTAFLVDFGDADGSSPRCGQEREQR